MKLVEVLNAIDTNAAAILAIAAGVVLSVCDITNAGTCLITGGFALLQHRGQVSK